MTDSAEGEGASSAGGSIPVLAIVGRPNAGKSTLFNRLTKSQRAIVNAEPGVTRDRNFAEAWYDDRRFVIVDTGGLDLDAAAGMAAAIRVQSEAAIQDADGVILLLDGRAGLTPSDREVIERLRHSSKPFWVAVNKLDVPSLDDDASDFFALGVDEVFPISAAHGRGVAELLERALDQLAAPHGSVPLAAPGAIAVAIVGRPNVGKSSLLNRLVGYDRSIVTPLAGTTRDAIDTPLSRGTRDYLLVDTAGVRRRSRVHEELERGSVQRALRALERADVAVVVIDAEEGMTDQEARLAGLAWEKGRALLLVVNKSDLLEARRRIQAQLEGEIRHAYPFLDAVPVVFTSAVTGQGVAQILPGVDRVSDNHRRQMGTAELNQLLQEVTRLTPPPSTRGLRPNFKYVVQTGSRPPMLTYFCSHPEMVPESYTRFLVNRLRQAFELEGTPVRFRYRRTSTRPE